MSLLRGGWLIALSLLGAMLLAVAHLPGAVPDWLRWLRPDWAVAAIFFWAAAAPERSSLAWCWFAGLPFDALLDEPLGLNGLGFALAGFIATRLHARLTIYTLAQRAAVVFVVVAIVHVIESLARTAFLGHALSWQLLVPAVTTMLVYPLLEWSLRPLADRFVEP